MKRLAGLVAAAIVATACSPLPPRPAPPPAPAAGDGDSVIGTPGNPAFYEVLGQRYYVMPSSRGYRERGVASWYGEKFHGRNTSNGERYDMYQLTAAHKTLPIPTWVRVTNLRNGASIVVRVNDRGPFVKNRIIDLSFAAAQALDMVGSGTTLVEVTALGGDPAGPLTAGAATAETMPYVSETVEVQTAASLTTPDAAGSIESDPVPTTPPAPYDTAVANRIYVQVGAYSDPANARRMAATLYNDTGRDVRVADGERNGLPLYRVQVGPLASVADYDRLVVELEALGIVDTHLITD